METNNLLPVVAAPTTLANQPLHPGFARALKHLGHEAIPIRVGKESKKPLERDWQKLTKEDLTEDYLGSFSEEENVGIKLEFPIWTLDYDQNRDGSVAELLEANPLLKTTFCTQRGSGTGCNFWFKATSAGKYPKTAKLWYSDGTPFGEIRGLGGQTMIYGRAASKVGDDDMGSYEVVQDFSAIEFNPVDLILPEDVVTTEQRRKRRSAPAKASNAKKTAESLSVNSLPEVVMPGGSVSISGAASALFSALAETGVFFIYQGKLHLLIQEEGAFKLKPLSTLEFASEIERHVVLVSMGKNGPEPTILKERDAQTLLATREAKALVPTVSKISKSPLLSVAKGQLEVLHGGYHPEHGKVLILSEETIERLEVKTAVAIILSVLDGFCFATEADMGRAVTMLMTIAATEMGFLKGILRPMFMVTASKSQSGKSLLIHAIAKMNEMSPHLITQRGRGGVGSLEESLATAFAQGGIIVLDNLRGELDCPQLESALTSRGKFPVRVPYQGEVDVDIDGITVTSTSNGVRLTPDQVNRTLFIQLSKTEERPLDAETEVALMERIESQIGSIRSAIYSLMADWYERGKPSVPIIGFHRVEWAGIMNWILSYQFMLPPLLEDHNEVADFMRSRDRLLLRDICRCVELAERLGEEMRAADVAEIYNDFASHAEIGTDRGALDHKRFGQVMKALLRGGDSVTVDNWRVTRKTAQANDSGRGDPVNLWRVDHVRLLPVTNVKSVNTPGQQPVMIEAEIIEANLN